jgi:hypothetical protein
VANGVAVDQHLGLHSASSWVLTKVHGPVRNFLTVSYSESVTPFSTSSPHGGAAKQMCITVCVVAKNTECARR